MILAKINLRKLIFICIIIISLPIFFTLLYYLKASEAVLIGQPPMKEVKFEFSQTNLPEITKLYKEKFEFKQFKKEKLEELPTLRESYYLAINATRTENGVGVLKPNSKLELSTQRKVTDMGRFDCWSHNCEGIAWSSYIVNTGLSYTMIGEILGRGFRGDIDRNILRWLESDLHREQMLEPAYTDFGVSCEYFEKFDGQDFVEICVVHFSK